MNLKERVQQLDASDVASLLGYKLDKLGNYGEMRQLANEWLIDKIQSGEIDEIELIIIESGN